MMLPPFVFILRRGHAGGMNVFIEPRVPARRARTPQKATIGDKKVSQRGVAQVVRVGKKP